MSRKSLMTSLALAGAFGCFAGGTVRASDLPSTREAPAPQPPAAKPADICRTALGERWFNVGGSGVCLRVGASALGYAGRDFANSDIALVGQRLPTQGNLSPNLPMLFYYSKDFRDQTRDGYWGIDASINFTAIAMTELGPVKAFLNLRGNGRYSNNEQGNARFEFATIDGSYTSNALDQAWVHIGGLRVGVQPSLFGFNRLGYSINPGYSSYVNTPAVSYTHRVGDVFSASVALEDPSRRRMHDGVLAYYASTNTPDVVAQARFGSPTYLLHVSGALHKIRDRAADLCCETLSNRSTTGWAALAGGEYRFAWSDLMGDPTNEMRGKLMVTAAADGALAYLGIPMMSLDYVANADGSLKKSSGQSVIASYEHMWARDWKSALTVSAFRANMSSSPAPFIGDALMWFSTDVQGQRLQAGVEHMPQPGVMVGIEASWNWSRVRGEFASHRGDAVTASYPELVGYMRWLY